MVQLRVWFINFDYDHLIEILLLRNCSRTWLREVEVEELLEDYDLM